MLGVLNLHSASRQRYKKNLNAAFTHAGFTPGTERKACIKVFLCCQVHAIYSLWRG